MTLTFPLKKSVLVARVIAMTEKRAATVPEASAEGIAASAEGIAASKATDSRSDQLLLLTALRSAVDALSVYLSGESYGVTSVTDTLCDDNDEFAVSMEVGERFNSVMRQPLVSAFSDYIVRYMLYEWYSAFSTDVAQSHFSALPFIQQNIARCFRKVSGTASAGVFPSEVHFDYEMPKIIEEGQKIFVPYVTVSDNPKVINDICLDHLHPFVLGTLRDSGVDLVFRSAGSYEVTIFSYHDPSVCDSLTFVVQPYV